MRETPANPTHYEPDSSPDPLPTTHFPLPASLFPLIIHSMNTRSLSNSVSLVTGGTRGIGRAIATMLLKEGASVAICGRSQESVDEAVRTLAAETGGKVV